MEIYTIQRPSLLLAACAPSASILPVSAYAAPTAPRRALVSRVHQAPIQAELDWANGSATAVNGTTGFVGSNGVTVKAMTDDAKGVPPRGRPV